MPRRSSARSVTEQGYFAFAEQALSERRAAGLPPFSHLALLRAEAHKPGQAEGFLDEACSAAERLLGELGLTGIELLGPVPAPMERRAGRYRAQLLLQGRVVGQVGLDNHFARFFGAACTACDLYDQLRHTLACAEISGEQAAVGIQDRHQGYPWKVMPFGKHLCADQDARLAFLDGGEQLVHRVFARRAVAGPPTPQ